MSAAEAVEGIEFHHHGDRTENFNIFFQGICWAIQVRGLEVRFEAVPKFRRDVLKEVASKIGDRVVQNALMAMIDQRSIETFQEFYHKAMEIIDDSERYRIGMTKTPSYSRNQPEAKKSASYSHNERGRNQLYAPYSQVGHTKVPPIPPFQSKEGSGKPPARREVTCFKCGGAHSIKACPKASQADKDDFFNHQLKALPKPNERKPMTRAAPPVTRSQTQSLQQISKRLAAITSWYEEGEREAREKEEGKSDADDDAYYEDSISQDSMGEQEAPDDGYHQPVDLGQGSASVSLCEPMEESNDEAMVAQIRAIRGNMSLNNPGRTSRPSELVMRWNDSGEFRALADSGSEINSIGLEDIKELELLSGPLIRTDCVPDSHPVTQLVMADGSRSPVVKIQSIWVTITTKGQPWSTTSCKPIKFHMIAGKTGQAILGCPWLTSVGINIEQLVMDSLDCARRKDQEIQEALPPEAYPQPRASTTRVVASQNMTPLSSEEWEIIKDRNGSPEQYQRDGNPTIPPGILRLMLITKHREDLTRQIDVDPAVIKLKEGAPPIYSKQQRHSIKNMAFIEAETRRYLALGKIRKAPTSQVVSNLVVVNDAQGDPKRITTDARRVNVWTTPCHYPMNDNESSLMQLVGARVFSKADLQGAFNQIPVSEESMQLQGFQTQQGIFQWTTLMQGGKNSAALCQSTMTHIFGHLRSVIINIDDILLYSSTLEEHEALITVFLALCRRFNVILNWNKSLFFQSSIKFCGRIIDSNGSRFDTDLVQGISALRPPATGGELLSLLHSANYIRTAIPDYARQVQPLNDLMNSLHEEAGNRTRKGVQRKSLASLWTDKHDTAFQKIKKMVINQVSLGYHRPDWDTYVVSDASDIGHSLVIAQADPVQRNLPLQEKDFKILVCQSGVFTGAPTRYDVVSKELYPLVRAIERFHYLLHSDREFIIVTDNMTVRHLLKPGGAVTEKSATALNRIFRWLLKFQSFRYTVEHVDGVRNHFLDLLSRWQPPDSSGSAQVAAIRFVKENDEKRELIERVHKGFGGHRGAEATFIMLQSRYHWPGMRSDVEKYVKQCIHCLSSKHKSPHERPEGESHRGVRPNQVVSVDFQQLLHKQPKDKSCPKYIFAVKCTFSGFTKLYPTLSTTADEAATYMTDWIATFGVPDMIISDQGSAFMGKAFTRISDAFKIQLHRVSAYHHGANAVERSNRVTLEALGALMSELRAKHDEWYKFIPMIQRAINNTPSRRLLGFSPAQVMLRCPSQNPVTFSEEELAVSKCTASEVVRKLKIFTEGIARQDLLVLGEASAGILQRHLETKRSKDKNRPSIQFAVGDLVLCYDPLASWKLAPKFRGPYEVIEKRDYYVYKIKDVRTKVEKFIHTSRLLQYRPQSTPTLEEIKQSRWFASMSEVLAILDVARADDGTFALTVRKSGVEETEVERDVPMFREYPELVVEFCQKNSDQLEVRELAAKYDIRLDDGQEATHANGGAVAQSHASLAPERKEGRGRRLRERSPMRWNDIIHHSTRARGQGDGKAPLKTSLESHAPPKRSSRRKRQ